MIAPVDTVSEIAPPVTQLSVENKPIKIRKKRAPKHDFGNGNGRVFAHKHANGGGWVADTAKVSDDVYVGPRCEVFDYATVSGKVKMIGRVKVFGHSCVQGAWQRNGVVLSKNATIFGCAAVRDDVTMTDDSRVSGHASVSGTSRLFGQAIATDSAQVFSTTLMDRCCVRGGALIMRSHLSHDVIVETNAIVLGTTLNGFVTIQNFGQVINSRITNHRVGTRTVVMNNAIVLDNSTVFCPIVFKQHAACIRSAISINDSENDTPEIGNNVVIAGLSFHRRAELTAYMDRLTGRQGQGYAPPPAAAGQPAQFSTPRPNYLATNRNNRRIMTLQETTA